VEELHSKLQSCRDDAVKDACCSACEKLLVHIATSAKQGRPNPGFCRQVRQAWYCSWAGSLPVRSCWCTLPPAPSRAGPTQGSVDR
jgi:hypothetical protein